MSRHHGFHVICTAGTTLELRATCVGRQVNVPVNDVVLRRRTTISGDGRLEVEVGLSWSA